LALLGGHIRGCAGRGACRLGGDSPGVWNCDQSAETDQSGNRESGANSFSHRSHSSP
jgi:hypothetical protein